MNDTGFAGTRNLFWRLTPALCLSLVFLLPCAAPALAHDPGLSAVELSFSGNDLNAHLTYARADVEVLQKTMDLDVLKSLAQQSVAISADDRELRLNSSDVSFDDSNGIHFHLRFSGVNGTRLKLRSLLIPQLAAGHRQFLVLRSADNEPMGSRLLDAQNNGYELDLTTLPHAPSFWSAFTQFLVLGIEHIWMGFDHLAFLLALLLAGSQLRDAFKIITSFTIAHSITLSLATLNLVNLPSGFVEAVIAISIVYVGIENLLCRKLEYRWLLTFGFGLIHGFGFASALQESGIGTGNTGVAIPLLSFNIGVELGQLAFAALLLPLIWKLKQFPYYVMKFAPICSMLIVIAGMWWLFERTILPLR
jgi:hydrogenase/urease accessory protein HupE